MLSKDVRINTLESQIEGVTQDLVTTKNQLSSLQQSGSQPLSDKPVPSSGVATPPQPTQSQLSSALSRASVAEQLAVECIEERMNHCILSPSDIVISGTPIHKGTYGYTAMAQFRGGVVGVRVLQQPPSSPYDRMVFMREVMKASRVIHPNIHLFMGVVMEESAIIVNESMTTNLRYELEKKAFTKQDILNIVGDVAKGLIFLHHSKPRPIIHRCVCTPMIYLERLAFKWRVKLSDTILPNYYHYINTDSTGNAMIMEPPFCPPEYNDMANHTPKYDIYSMGVVLLEVNCRKVPPNTKAEKDVLLNGIKWPSMVSIIGECISEDPSMRPSADQLIKTLEQNK